MTGAISFSQDSWKKTAKCKNGNGLASTYMKSGKVEWIRSCGKENANEVVLTNQN